MRTHVLYSRSGITEVTQSVCCYFPLLSQRMRNAVVALLIVGTVGCQEAPSEGITCPSVANSAVVIVIADAQSGAFSPFADVRVVVKNGAYQESAFFEAISDEYVRKWGAGIGLAAEQPGTFDITVSAAGYQAWSASNFRTTNNLKCRAASDTVVARLRRL